MTLKTGVLAAGNSALPTIIYDVFIIVFPSNLLTLFKPREKLILSQFSRGKLHQRLPITLLLLHQMPFLVKIPSNNQEWFIKTTSESYAERKQDSWSVEGDYGSFLAIYLSVSGTGTEQENMTWQDCSGTLNSAGLWASPGLPDFFSSPRLHCNMNGHFILPGPIGTNRMGTSLAWILMKCKDCVFGWQNPTDRFKGDRCLISKGRGTEGIHVWFTPTRSE